MTDVITNPGLYETRMGEFVEVTAEESQSEGKQWVVRCDGSPTYYTTDGRRVSYKGPGSEHDDQYQLMRYVGPPPVMEHIPVSAPAPITVKPGWWRMRDGEEILVFEWKPDPPMPNNPFKWCGMTPAADVIFWTDGGYCNFNASAATQDISDEDLLDFIRPLDADEVVSLNETLREKHRVIQEMTHQITDLQSELATRRSQAETMRQVIETKTRVIERQGIDIEATIAARLADLQQRYNDMVVDRDEWQDKATGMERIVASNYLTIGSLQSQVSHLSKKQQSPDDHQAAMDGIAALRAEIDKLSTEKESIARLALGKQEENDSLRQQNSDLTASLQAERDKVARMQVDLERCLSANSELADKLSRIREQVSHPNLSLIATKLATPDNQQQQQIIISGLMILSQLVRKNMDYQGSAFTPPVLLPKTSPIVAMCCRASDKIARLANLLSGNRKQVQSETVLDTIGDLAGYSVLLYSYCNTILGMAELEAFIERASDTESDTTTIDTTEERQS